MAARATPTTLEGTPVSLLKLKPLPDYHHNYQQRQRMIDFAKAYKAWVDSGAPEDHPIFRRWFSLCWCSVKWLRADKSIDKPETTAHLLHQAMRSTWADGGQGCVDFPFGGHFRWTADKNGGAMHLNMWRMCWINWAANGMEHPPEPAKASTTLWQRVKGWCA